MKDKIKYEIQCFDDIYEWYTVGVGIKTKKEAKLFVRDTKDWDKVRGLKIKYRIVKITIKKEIVK